MNSASGAASPTPNKPWAASNNRSGGVHGVHEGGYGVAQAAPPTIVPEPRVATLIVSVVAGLFVATKVSAAAIGVPVVGPT